MAVLFLKEAINSGELTVAEAGKVIDKGHNVLELSSALQDRDVTAVEPTRSCIAIPHLMNATGNGSTAMARLCVGQTKMPG